MVGEFVFDLSDLLARGYVRKEGSKSGAIRLRFYHGTDDVIYVQTNSKGPALRIGKVS